MSCRETAGRKCERLTAEEALKEPVDDSSDVTSEAGLVEEKIQSCNPRGRVDNREVLSRKKRKS